MKRPRIKDYCQNVNGENVLTSDFSLAAYANDLNEYIDWLESQLKQKI